MHEHVVKRKTPGRKKRKLGKKQITEHLRSLTEASMAGTPESQ